QTVKEPMFAPSMEIRPMVSMAARSECSASDTCPATTWVAAFLTSLDWMAIAWSDDRLQGVVFGYVSRQHAERALKKSLKLNEQSCEVVDDIADVATPHWVGNLVDDLRRFAAGEPIDFSNVPLSLEHLTPFARRVVDECRRISWGKTRSYGELAAASSAP